MILGIWWVVLILIVSVIIESAIVEFCNTDNLKIIGIILSIIYIPIGIGFINPLWINSLLNYIGLEVAFTWYEVLPVAWVIGLSRANLSNARTLRIAKSYFKRKGITE